MFDSYFIVLIFLQRANNGIVSRERTSVASRAFRSGSAPTPTPPKQSQNGSNNYYNRRPTVVFNDERSGPSEKSTGAQARVNQKFVSLQFLSQNEKKTGSDF